MKKPNILLAVIFAAHISFAQETNVAENAAQTNAVAAAFVPTQEQLDSGYYPVRRTAEVIPERPPARKITIPNVGRLRVLKGDFHMHTIYSDGHVMPRTRVAEAIDNGLDIISVTDHIGGLNRTSLVFGKMGDDFDYDKSHELATEADTRNRLVVVRGAELSGPVFHFNALFLTNVNQIATVIDCMDGMIGASVEQGAFVMWNHPNWTDRDPDNPPFGLKTGEPMRFLDEVDEWYKKGWIHGIEVLSGATYFPIAHDWCVERDLAVIANTDIHNSDLQTYGRQNPMRPMTLVLARRKDLESVREAFFAKRTIGWAAGNIYGRQPWVGRLYTACVESEETENGIMLNNLSDIACTIEAGGKIYELPAQGSVLIPKVRRYTVNNWFVGIHKPLAVRP